MAEPVRRRLVRRVALVSAAASAIGGALASSVAGIVAVRLVGVHEDDQVLTYVAELAAEVDEELDDDHSDDDDDDADIIIGPDGHPTLASVVAHELHDVKRPLASAAVFDDGALLTGDATLAPIEPGRCVGNAHGPAARRTCGAMLADGRLIVLAVSAEDERQRRSLLAWALVIGALAGAGLGGVVSHKSATWSLAPLTSLRDRVRRIDATSPNSAALEPSAAHVEVEELRTAIAGLVDRLAASLTQAQSFAANAAHELRTPLALIAGELELLLEDSEHPAGSRDVLLRLHQHVQELTRLTQRLLILAGPARLRINQCETVDLYDVLDTVLSSLTPDDRARLHTEAEDDVVVRGDFELLRSVLHNAIDNALKFSSGPVDIHITKAEHASIDVLDHGPGISASERQRLFEPFVRGTTRAPGHGIGLTLIAHVAEVHGGRAEFVDSTAGAHLRVTLPRWSA